MNLMDQAKQWFAQLAPREQVMVAACAAFIVVALIWTMAIQPLFNGGAELAERVAQKQSQLTTLQEMAAQVSRASDGRSGATAMTNSNDSIVVVIDKTTRSRQLAQHLKRNQPDGNNSVRLRFEGAGFDSLVAWLGELKTNYGMTMVTASFDEAGSGRVNCSLVITRAGI
jgi:general secretion pathway protein M